MKGLVSAMSKIVFGGGWKDKREERVKVKAWVFLFVAIYVWGNWGHAVH